MHLIGLFILSIAKVLRLLINLYTFIIAITVLLGWVNPDPYNPIIRFLHQVTAPVFIAVRRFVPRVLFKTGFDFTPVIVFIILIFVDTVFVGFLFDLAQTLMIQ